MKDASDGKGDSYYVHAAKSVVGQSKPTQTPAPKHIRQISNTSSKPIVPVTNTGLNPTAVPFTPSNIVSMPMPPPMPIPFPIQQQFMMKTHVVTRPAAAPTPHLPDATSVNHPLTPSTMSKSEELEMLKRKVLLSIPLGSRKRKAAKSKGSITSPASSSKESQGFQVKSFKEIMAEKRLKKSQSQDKGKQSASSDARAAIVGGMKNCDHGSKIQPVSATQKGGTVVSTAPPSKTATSTTIISTKKTINLMKRPTNEEKKKDAPAFGVKSFDEIMAEKRMKKLKSASSSSSSEVTSPVLVTAPKLNTPAPPDAVPPAHPSQPSATKTKRTRQKDRDIEQEAAPTTPKKKLKVQMDTSHALAIDALKKMKTPPLPPDDGSLDGPEPDLKDVDAHAEDMFPDTADLGDFDFDETDLDKQLADLEDILS